MIVEAAVVVGFDGSAGSARAVRFAAEDAALRRRTLKIVHVRDGVTAYGESSARLRTAYGIARGYLGAEQILTAEPIGTSAAELVAASSGAELLVVGRGEVSTLGAALGSVAMDVVAHASCPVATVAMTDPAAGDPNAVHAGVVAGIKRFEQAEPILETAFLEAELRGCGLQVIHAWKHPQPGRHGEILFPVHDPVLYGEEQSERLAGAVQVFADKYPDVPVSTAAPHAGAIDALLVAAAPAALVVIGAPHRGPVRGMILGSVGQTLIRQLVCPVILVHPDDVTPAR